MVLRFLIILILSANVSLANDLRTITAEEFYLQNPSIERKAIIDSMLHQFDGKSVSQKDIDEIWSREEFRESQYLLRFQIVNQQLYTYESDVKGLFFLELVEYFKKLLKIYKINDVDFLVYGRDEIVPDPTIKPEDINIPSFMMSKNLNSPYEKDRLLFPDAFMLRKSWSDRYQEIEKANKEYPWQNKIDKIFWRGASTGWDREQPYNLNGYNLNNFDKFVRVKLVMLSKLYPDLIDAEMAFYPQFSKDQSGKNLRKILDTLFPGEDRAVQAAKHLKYKYLISVDGNTCSWERVPWIMLSNSALVKQETQNIEWFYSALKPYVHYIPVNESLTDLFQIIEWMKNHDSEVQKISENAHNFVKNNLKPNDINDHMAIILNEYSKIQKDEEIKITLTPAEDAISLQSLIRLVIHKKFKMWFNL